MRSKSKGTKTIDNQTVRTFSLVSLMAIACSIFVLFALSGCAKKVEVPDLYLEEQGEAEKILAESGLKVGTITEEESQEVTLGGIVCKQSVEAGTSVDEGTAVDLVVSTGPKLTDPVAVPDLTGMTPEEAEEALLAALIVPQPGKATYSDEVKPGLVCAQSVAAGTRVMPFDQPVTYSTSLGKEKIAVPDVVGKSLDSAREALKKAELSCDSTTTYSDSVAEGNVISQDIANGEKVEKGTVVTLEVSLGPKPVKQVVVPNIISYGLQSAIRTIESAGLVCNYWGDEDGTVISVNPAPGTTVDQGTTIDFELKLPEKTTPSEKKQEKGQNKNPLTQAEAEKIVLDNELGEIVDIRELQGNDDIWYWQVTCRDDDGNEHTYMIDPNGKLTNVDVEDPEDPSEDTGYDDLPSESEVEDIVWQNGLGELVDMQQVQANDDLWYWQVTCNDADGNEHTYMIGTDGSWSEV